MRDRECNSHSKIIGASLAGAAALSAYLFLIRPWHLRWGATDEEIGMPLPGDELVPRPNLEATHAITIEAPMREVWPWLVQIGQDKGGFYSYTVARKLSRLPHAQRRPDLARVPEAPGRGYCAVTPQGAAPARHHL